MRSSQHGKGGRHTRSFVLCYMYNSFFLEFILLRNKHGRNSKTIVSFSSYDLEKSIPCVSSVDFSYTYCVAVISKLDRMVHMYILDRVEII